METNIKANLKTTNLKDLGNIPGKMADTMRDNGKIILCMGRGSSNGKMDRNLRGNMKMIKKMVLECLFSQIQQKSKENGRTAKYLEKEL